MHSAIERAHALLALRGAGATQESVRQMASIYADDTDITPDIFVTPKFAPAKAITAFGGYAVYLGLATDTEVINQRDVYGEAYASLDFSLEKDAFSDRVDELAASIVAVTNDKARNERLNGNFATLKVNALIKLVSLLTPSNMAPTSKATKDALAGAGRRCVALGELGTVLSVPEVKEDALV